MTSIANNYNYTHKGDFNFKQLCGLLLNKEYDKARLKLQTLYKQLKLEDFVLQAGGYSRNIIIDTDDCWLGIIRWESGAQTPVHGHPEQTFFYVLCGELLCHNFKKESLLMTDSQLFTQHGYYHSQGIKGRMDNFIHKISANQPSVSLHFYSDNPSKGESFDI